MSSRLKVILLGGSGEKLDYKYNSLKAIAESYVPDLKLSGKRIEDLETMREIFATRGMLLFTWREAKEAKGRDELVKKLQQTLKTVRTRVLGEMVIKQVQDELSGKRKKKPKTTSFVDWFAEQARPRVPEPEPQEVELDLGDMEPNDQ